VHNFLDNYAIRILLNLLIIRLRKHGLCFCIHVLIQIRPRSVSEFKQHTIYFYADANSVSFTESRTNSTSYREAMSRALPYLSTLRSDVECHLPR